MLIRRVFISQNCQIKFMSTKQTVKMWQDAKKQMKSKDRITVMVCTAATGAKMPLTIGGKAKQPAAFKYELPTGQGRQSHTPVKAKRGLTERSLFGGSTMCFGHIIFVSMVTFGRSFCLITVPHTELDASLLPKMLRIIFFPPNLTSRHQPADMGMIASLKVGYKFYLLSTLLAIFDEVGGYERAEAARNRRRKACAGIKYGGNATVLDAINFLCKVLEDGLTYVTSECIQRCWRKADILPTSVKQR
jgi:hypothetical protein